MKASDIVRGAFVLVCVVVALPVVLWIGWTLDKPIADRLEEAEVKK